MRYLLLIVLGFLAACGKDEPASNETIPVPGLPGVWIYTLPNNSNCGLVLDLGQSEYNFQQVCRISETQGYLYEETGIYFQHTQKISFQLDKSTCQPNPDSYEISIVSLSFDDLKVTLNDGSERTYEKYGEAGQKFPEFTYEITRGCFIEQNVFEPGELN